MRDTAEAYMAALNDLRREVNRELDIVQLGGPPRAELIRARERASAARVDYMASLGGLTQETQEIQEVPA